jgi:hypothetical protein
MPRCTKSVYIMLPAAVGACGESQPPNARPVLAVPPVVPGGLCIQIGGLSRRARRPRTMYGAVDPPSVAPRYVFAKRRDAGAPVAPAASRAPAAAAARAPGAGAQAAPTAAADVTDRRRGGARAPVVAWAPAGSAAPAPQGAAGFGGARGQVQRSKSMTALESGPRCRGRADCAGAVTRRCMSCEEHGWMHLAYLCDACYESQHVRSFSGVVGGGWDGGGWCRCGCSCKCWCSEITVAVMFAAAS